MASHFPRRRVSLLCLLIASSLVRSSMALNMAYCSSQNTGGGSIVETSIYQSDGRCHDSCLANYAFAIVQGENCWCSNYIPANQQSTSKCNDPCPGYPSDTCGSSSLGLYGYIALNIKPSGTAGAAASTTLSVQAATTTNPSDSTSAPKATISPTPVTNVQVVTVSGNIITQTVTTTPTAPSSAVTGAKQTSSIAPGYIAVAVIASLFGVAFIFAALFWCWKRKKGGEDSENANASARDMQRNISVHSKAGLLDNKQYPPVITTRFNHNIDLSSSDGPSPVSPMSERRSSKPLVYDQRLNPNALMSQDNGSRTSLQTLDDHRDYGRMLKVMNPDENPERPSFS